VLANVSQDTLDYTGPSVNKGSKAMMMGLGKEPKRVLPENFNGELPSGVQDPRVFLPGTLVVQGEAYGDDKELPARLAAWPGFADWPVVLLVDDSRAATANLQEFLWSFFTRFEPAADIYSAKTGVNRFHVGLEEPIVFDCRMKPWYPHVLEVDEETRKLVDGKMSRLVPSRWR